MATPRWRRRARPLTSLAAGLLAFAAITNALAVPGGSGAAPVANANENAKTLVLDLPGPFSGCPYLSTGATPVSDAVLDLVRPSAFVTEANGTLTGEDGPIASAELTSLTPETVRYAIAPNEHWSNGALFTGVDLVNWWLYAKRLASVASDGYRAIKSLTISDGGLTVTAVFSRPDADWDLLFRDVEARPPSDGCAVGNLVARPSLGPYRVTSASAHRVVLAMNGAWPLNPNRFGRVVITDSTQWPSASVRAYARMTTSLTRSSLEALSTRSTLLSRIASSSAIEELTFAPATSVSAPLALREALSWSITRQSLIDHIFGSITFSPSVAASAIYSQGQNQYPGTSGTGLGNQSPTTTSGAGTSNGLADCASCAVAVLKEAGYHRTVSGWVDAEGTALRVRVAIGPTGLDRDVANLVRADWSSLGVASRVVRLPTAADASFAAASGRVDVAIFARPTATTPAYAARSWAGPAYRDTFPSGVRLAIVTDDFARASTIFNPVTASSTWLNLDQTILNNFLVRPLFTPPSLAVWSTNLVTVQNTVSVAGFVDQVVDWSLAPATPSGS